MSEIMEDLKNLAWGIVDACEKNLLETGSCAMVHFIIGEHGDVEVQQVDDPAIINSPAGKDAVTRMIRETVRKIDGYAVITVSDAFVGEASIERAGGVEQARKISNEIGVVEAGKRGLLDTHGEALTAFIVTKVGQSMMLAAHYTREGQEPNERITMGKRETRLPQFSEGRLADYFK